MADRPHPEALELPMDLPRDREVPEGTPGAKRCRFCRKTLKDESELVWRVCGPCLDGAEW